MTIYLIHLTMEMTFGQSLVRTKMLNRFLSYLFYLSIRQQY